MPKRIRNVKDANVSMKNIAHSGVHKKSTLYVFWILGFPWWKAFNLIAKMRENEVFFMFRSSMALFWMDSIKWKFWFSVRVDLWDLVHSHPLECCGQRVNASFYVLSRSSRKLLTFESHHTWWQEEISGECKGTSLLLLIQFSVPKADMLRILSGIWCQTINLCVWASTLYCSHFLNWRKGKENKSPQPPCSPFLRLQTTGCWGPCQICIK